MKRTINLEPFDTSNLAPQPLIGVDEVGRGCLAGPVFAAAVIFNEGVELQGLTDSKLISEKRREELSPLILSQHRVSIASASVEEIDEFNILNASLLAMKRAVEGLKVSVGHVLVDGNKKIPGLHLPQTTVIKGDLRVPVISAASIVAKVHRDQLMKSLAETFPGYGFEVHKGYSTSFHKESIQTLGPTQVHRKTFSGVKEFLR